MTDISTVNSSLKAKTKATSYKNDIDAKVTKVQDANKVNSTTVLGQNVQQSVNGFLSLDNNPQSSNTAGSLTQITPSASVYPSTDPKKLFVDVSTATTTITNVTEQITSLLYDSAGGVPLEDSAGNPITELVDGPTIPTVTQIGGDTPTNIPSITASLTGIIPPLESITIVSLGGAALDELAGAIEDAAERKGTLLSSINKTAGETSAAGLGDSIKDGIADVQKEMDKVKEDAKSNTLLNDIAGAVSAVQGIGDTVANAAASAAGTLTAGVGSLLGEATSAIKDGFKKVTAEIGTAVKNLVDGALPDIDIGFGTGQNLFEDLTGSIGGVLTGLFGQGEELDKGFLSGILNDVMTGGDINLTKATKALALKDKSLSSEMRKVIQETNADDVATFNSRVQSKAIARGIPAAEIASFSDLSNNIENALAEIDTTIAGSIVSEAGEFYTEDLDLAELAKRYSAGYIREFSYVDSKEELGLEFVRMTREVSEVIVHASETYTNANIGAEEIQLRHNEAGHLGIQYHFVIRRDGTMQRGLPIDNVSDASDVNRHKFNCIDVCLVGGVNVPSEADNPLLNLSASSFTISQMKTLETLLELFYQTVPGGQVMGHNDIDESSLDPYFDVISFVENKFGKKSVYLNPLTDTSLDRAGLQGKKAV